MDHPRRCVEIGRWIGFRRKCAFADALGFHNFLEHVVVSERQIFPRFDWLHDGVISSLFLFYGEQEKIASWRTC